MGGKKAEETIAVGSFPFGPVVSQPEAPAPLHPFVKGLSFCLIWGEGLFLAERNEVW